MNKILKDGLTYGTIGTAMVYLGNTLLKAFPEAHFNPEVTEYLQNTSALDYALQTLKQGPIVGAGLSAIALGAKGIKTKVENSLEKFLMSFASLTSED